MHGGNLWALLEDPALSQERVLDFSANLNPLGPPEGLLSFLEEQLRWVDRYPEPTYQHLRQAIGAFHGVPPEVVLSGNGATDLIHLISRWQAAGHRDSIEGVVVSPTFGEYERAIVSDGGKVKHWGLQEQETIFVCPELSTRPLLKTGGMLLLCNPNNPTGTLWPEATLVQLLRQAEAEGVCVVVDESYLDWVVGPGLGSLVGRIAEFQNLVVLRSLTKSFSIPSLRLGYLVAAPETVQTLGRMQPSWSVNGLASAAGEWLLPQKAYLDQSREKMVLWREEFWRQLKEIPGVQPYVSQANFLLCRLSDSAWSVAHLAHRLRKEGFLIRVCDDLVGLKPGRFFRVAVRWPDENKRLVEMLERILSHGG